MLVSPTAGGDRARRATSCEPQMFGLTLWTLSARSSCPMTCDLHAVSDRNAICVNSLKSDRPGSPKEACRRLICAQAITVCIL
jgi:hypothetical protein